MHTRDTDRLARSFTPTLMSSINYAAGHTPEHTVPTTAEAVAAVKSISGWGIHIALKQAEHMKNQQWLDFVAALERGGLKELAKAMREHYTKNGTTTVLTTAAATAAITRTHNLRRMTVDGQEVMSPMSPEQRSALLAHLRTKELTKYVARELELLFQ